MFFLNLKEIDFAACFLLYANGSTATLRKAAVLTISWGFNQTRFQNRPQLLQQQVNAVYGCCITCDLGRLEVWIWTDPARDKDECSLCHFEVRFYLLFTSQGTAMLRFCRGERYSDEINGDGILLDNSAHSSKCLELNFFPMWINVGFAVNTYKQHFAFRQYWNLGLISIAWYCSLFAANNLWWKYKKDSTILTKLFFTSSWAC